MLYREHDVYLDVCLDGLLFETSLSVMLNATCRLVLSISECMRVALFFGFGVSVYA